GSSRSGWDARARTAQTPETTLAQAAGATTEGELPTSGGKTSGDPESRRRNEEIGHSHGAGSVYPASNAASLTGRLGCQLLRAQLRVQTEPHGTSGDSQGAGVHQRRLGDRGGHRLGEVLRPSQP